MSKIESANATVCALKIKCGKFEKKYRNAGLSWSVKPYRETKKYG